MLEFSAFQLKTGGYAHFIKGGLVLGNSIEHRIQLIKHDEHKHKMIQNIIYIRPYSADVYRECNIREQLLTAPLVTLWLKCGVVKRHCAYQIFWDTAKLAW